MSHSIAVGARACGNAPNWQRRGCNLYLEEEIAMFKVAVVAFALAISGFMLWVAHENSNFAQLPHATFVKRAA